MTIVARHLRKANNIRAYAGRDLMYGGSLRSFLRRIQNQALKSGRRLAPVVAKSIGNQLVEKAIQKGNKELEKLGAPPIAHEALMTVGRPLRNATKSKENDKAHLNPLEQKASAVIDKGSRQLLDQLLGKGIRGLGAGPRGLGAGPRGLGAGNASNVFVGQPL